LREAYRFTLPEKKDLPALRDILAGDPEVHLYFLSRLDREISRRRRDGEILVLKDGEGRVEGGLFLGREANLAVSSLPPGARPAFFRTVLSRGRGFQVGVSPKPEIDFLVERLSGRATPLLHRTQALYVLDRDGALGREAEDLVPAGREDLPWLAEAGFLLAREDLGIPPGVLNRERLRRVAAHRMKSGRTFVIRRNGRPVFKVNIAVRTREGALVEGVFTDPEYRGQGLASGGVAALCRRLLEEVPMVALHVGTQNLPARKAYERAGFRFAGELGLVLYLPW